jgi:hypothetical protein
MYTKKKNFFLGIQDGEKSNFFCVLNFVEKNRYLKMVGGKTWFPLTNFDFLREIWIWHSSII